MSPRVLSTAPSLPAWFEARSTSPAVLWMKGSNDATARYHCRSSKKIILKNKNKEISWGQSSGGIKKRESEMMMKQLSPSTLQSEVFGNRSNRTALHNMNQMARISEILNITPLILFWRKNSSYTQLNDCKGIFTLWKIDYSNSKMLKWVSVHCASVWGENVGTKHDILCI